jgi:hypothetical protein
MLVMEISLDQLGALFQSSHGDEEISTGKKGATQTQHGARIQFGRMRLPAGSAGCCIIVARSKRQALATSPVYEGQHTASTKSELILKGVWTINWTLKVLF